MIAPVRLLTRRDLSTLLRPADYLDAMDIAFRAVSDGRAQVPPPWHLEARGGAFHGKGAVIDHDGVYAVLKFNGNFPDNAAKHGLPTIQGALLLSNAENGALLSIQDSIEITLRRTAAASALAAKHLARANASTLFVAGCGEQGRAHVEALSAVRPLRSGFAWDVDGARAAAFARDVRSTHAIDLTPTTSLDHARTCDIIATCTTSRAAFLGAEHVAPGAFVAAVGADSPAKSEIAPELMAAARIVVDSLEQCCAMGDLRHALAAGALRVADVHAALADIAAGKAAGRRSDRDIFVFDSTGTAAQDAAAAVTAWRRAERAGAGQVLNMGAP